MKRSHERFDVSAARWGAMCIAAVLMVSGCSASGGGIDTEAAGVGSSPSAGTDSAPAKIITSSATPTPTAAAYKPATAENPAENVPLPVMPEIAKEEPAEGLHDFAKHWYDLMNYGFETGDVEPLKQASGPDCVVCGNVYRILGNGYDEEDWTTGRTLVVMGTKTNYVLNSRNVYQVLIQIKQGLHQFRGPDRTMNGENDGVPGSTVQMSKATYADGQWVANNAVTIQ